MELTLLGKGGHLLASAIDGRPNVEISTFLESDNIEGISNRIDFDLNSMQGLTDSLKEVLKQAMLHQEVIFRNQVVELHRLYWTQKNLMNNLCWRDFDENAGLMNTSSSIPKQAGNVFLMPRSLMMSSTPAKGSNTSEECCKDSSKLHLTPETNFDAPFDVYTKNEAAMKYLQMQNTIHNNSSVDSDPQELALSHGSMKYKSDKKRGDRLTPFGKWNCPSTQDVIDLSEPKEFGFHTCKEVRISSSFSFQAHIAEPASMTGAQLSAQSDLTYERARSKEFLANKEVSEVDNTTVSGAWLPSLQENRMLGLNHGLNDSGGCLFSDKLVQEQCSSTHKLWRFDLNTPQIEEFPEASQNQEHFHRNEDDPVVVRSVSLTEPYGKPNGGMFGSLDVGGQAKVSGLISPSLGMYHLREDAGAPLAVPGCDIPGDRQIISTASSDTNEENYSGQSLEIGNLLKKASSESELTQANCDRSEEDTVSSSPHGNLMSVRGTIFASLSELQHGNDGEGPIGAGGHRLLSVSYDTQRSQISSVVTEQCSGMHRLITEADDHVGLPEKTSSHCGLQLAENLEKKGNSAAETDFTMWEAAESLIHMSLSLQSTSNSLDEAANVGQTELGNKRGSNRPQYSSDSFEGIVLALTESLDDECSTPCGLTKEETGKVACRFKLRKGRGLRDFQKEILPGLISLSRHEICEDLHAIAAAVRMHESRKGSRALCGGTWFPPVRSRRSRLNYVVRRWY